MGWVNWWSPSLSSYPAAPPPQRTQSRDFPCTTSHSHSLQDHPKHSNKLTKVVRLLTTQVSGAPPGGPTPQVFFFLRPTSSQPRATEIT